MMTLWWQEIWSSSEQTLDGRGTSMPSSELAERFGGSIWHAQGDISDFGVASDIVRDGDAIYAVAKGDDLLCLDLANGKVRWHFATNFDRRHAAWENSPTLAENIVFFDGHDGFVYALGARSGELIWKTNLHAPVLTSPVIIGNSVYAGTATQFCRLATKDGVVMSSFPIPTKPWRNVILSGDRLLVISSDVFYSDIPSGLLSLSLAAHRVQWQVKLPAASSLYTVWPYVWHGEVLAADNGHLYAYNETDGSLVWSHDFPGQSVRGIGITPDTLYLGTMKGMIYAFTP